jgi:hypothetical protein
MVGRDKTDDTADTERIGEESNAVSARHGRFFFNELLTQDTRLPPRRENESSRVVSLPIEAWFDPTA